MEGNKEESGTARREQLYNHTVPMILRYDKDHEIEGGNREKLLHRIQQGTKSAFKEVRKRKSRFTPIDVASKEEDIGATGSSESRNITPRLLTNPYPSLPAYGIGHIGTDASKPTLASIQRNRFTYASRLAEPGGPALGVTFPYAAFSFFPHPPPPPPPPPPAIYFRDPFVLAAQNCCAKCGVQFRMTSDLVYHMRTHHKQELVNESNRERKPVEKYNCTVCQESFKEKHHLSRHMTSHDA